MKEFKAIGKSISRLDGKLKATGRAKYTDDYIFEDVYIAKVLRSSIANGIIKEIDISKAEKLEGVELVITYENVPKKCYSTSGHPFKLDERQRDIEDKNILTQRVRYYGDEIAAVVAINEKIANEALELIEVTYEEYSPILTAEESLKADKEKNYIHDGGNIIASSDRSFGKYDESFKKIEYKFKGKFKTPIVQHCHIEPQVAIGYMDDYERININTPNQVPFTLQRIVAEALDIPWGKVRIIKPFVGGGFGAKQDPVVEPLLAFLCTKLKNKKIKLEYTREEAFISRVRHGFNMSLQGNFTKDGKLVSTDFNILANNGAYTSHGHAVAETGMTSFRDLYKQEACICKATTVYTNLPTAGAMRGYGVPQTTFAQDIMMDVAAKNLDIDPVDIRIKNLYEEDFIDPVTNVRFRTSGMKECLERGRKLIRWNERKKEYKDQKGDIRKGVGVGAFCYQSSTYPVQIESAGSRIILLQDGTFRLELGATEIGQGSDTAMSQIVAHTLGIQAAKVVVETIQDTDTSPFDLGSYASRQTYVTGKIVKETAVKVKEKILDKTSEILKVDRKLLDIENDFIKNIETCENLLSIDKFSEIVYYDEDHFEPIRIEHSNKVDYNAMSYGCTFVDVSVDTRTGYVEINEIYNIHDSGKIINPRLAEGQIHGGMSMGLGYAMYEEMLFDNKGKPLNNNFLDYKIMSMVDTPKLNVSFVEEIEPTSAYGNKAIGEPPTIPEAPAIANAIYDAVGVRVYEIPITPEKVYNEIKLRRKND